MFELAVFNISPILFTVFKKSAEKVSLNHLCYLGLLYIFHNNTKRGVFAMYKTIELVLFLYERLNSISRGPNYFSKVYFF